MFELSLLGPITVRQAGRVLTLPTHKGQALLVLLALDGRAHRARLAGWLWPQVGEAGARRNLRRELARLREAGAGGLLLSESEVLALAPDVHCDALAFNAAVEAGHTAEALALWRGTLAEGLQTGDTGGFDDWLGSQRQRLGAQRRRALEAAVDAALAAGEPEAALAHTETLLAEDPLQEHQHRRAMQLHASAGRREAALAQYTRCRSLLAQELGLSPTAETEALAESLRLVAPDSVAPLPATPAPVAAPTPLQPWPAELPLVGRETLWARLEAAWAEGRPVLIEGPAGIGKSRLARDFAANRGPYALAQCRRADTGVPYASFTRALRRLAGATLGSVGLDEWVRAELARVLPELGPSAGPLGSAFERRRFFEAAAVAWRALADDSFDAVLLDDWHLADPHSRELVGYLVQLRSDAGHRGAREFLICRDELSDDTRASLRQLVDEAGAVHLQPGALEPAMLLELVRQLSGAAEPHRFTARLEQATGGNPFFVAETLRHWRELQLLSTGADGVWKTPFDEATTDYIELPLPDSVRDAVQARVRRLSEAAQRVLEAAALAAEPFNASLLAGACALSEVEALRAVDEAVQAQCLVERSGGHAFAHDLVQAALDSALGSDRRRLVHRRLALGAEAAGLAATEIARHWEAGGQPQRAVAHHIAAADAAAALFADDEAERHWQAALAGQPTLAQQLAVHTARWGHQRQREDAPGLQASLQALDQLRAEAETALDGTEVALHAAIEAAHLLSLISRPGEALERIDACLAGPITLPTRRAQALMVRAQALNNLGRTAEAIEDGQAALAVGGLSRTQEAQVAYALVFCHFLRSEPQPALAYARRCLQLWQSVGARRSVVRAHANMGLVLGVLGQHDEAIAQLELAYARGGELGMLQSQREVANNLADRFLHLGRPGRALQIAEAALAMSPHFSESKLPAFLNSMKVQAHFQLGELGQALDCAATARALALASQVTSAIVDAISMALDVHTAVGDEAMAAELIDSLEGLDLDGISHFRTKLAFNLIFHALCQGDLGRARQLVEGLGPPAAIEDQQDRIHAHIRHAQVLLAEARNAEALKALQPLWTEKLGAEAQALACTAQLQACAALGPVPPAELARADAALDSGVLPALPALLLRQQRAAAAAQAGDSAGAKRLHAECAAEALRMADSLQGRPALREHFLARWHRSPAG